jgi:hypothetical protein
MRRRDKDSGKDKGAVDISPCGEEIKIRVKTKERLMFRRAAKK